LRTELEKAGKMKREGVHSGHPPVEKGVPMVNTPIPKDSPGVSSLSTLSAHGEQSGCSSSEHRTLMNPNKPKDSEIDDRAIVEKSEPQQITRPVDELCKAFGVRKTQVLAKVGLGSASLILADQWKDGVISDAEVRQRLGLPDEVAA